MEDKEDAAEAEGEAASLAMAMAVVVVHAFAGGGGVSAHFVILLKSVPNELFLSLLSHSHDLRLPISSCIPCNPCNRSPIVTPFPNSLSVAPTSGHVPADSECRPNGMPFASIHAVKKTNTINICP